MRKIETADGQAYREMFSAATLWLEKSVADIDALNVFPVPDGDTGTNMLLTMRSAIEESYRAADHNASSVAQAMAKGALMGARGNSGVILSQIWKGMGEGLSRKETFTGRDFAQAYAQAAKTAYKGLNNPVEGTILTVIRESSDAGMEYVEHNGEDLVTVIETIVDAAGKSLSNTPNLLPVLKEAGVVDAGGQGLFTIMEGALRYLRGEGEQMQFRKPQIVTSSVTTTPRIQPVNVKEVPFGYCTEFLIKGDNINPDKLREKLKKNGESLIVVGDKSNVRVHIHTLDPGTVLHYVTSLGTIHQVSIRNMDEQHEDYLEMQKQRMPASDVAMIAVAPGEGITDVLNSLGAFVVPGGQTMNPSTKDLLQAVESIGADKIIILPNNKNIILTANQVHSLTQKTVKIIPTKTIPQGVAALLAFDYEADFETNTKAMEKARNNVRTVEITRAIRTTKIGDMKIRKNQAIGLLDTDLVSVGNTAMEVLDKVMEEIDLVEAEVVTIYYGQDIEKSDAEKISGIIRENYPELQIEVVKGGQPHYEYIISIE
ncbi:MAG: DAK2 domain-containing protein [Dehalococcoidales bacterium]|nr:DAK2 domain-containing protein [Dehalococcoidales bacterium]